MIPRVSNITFKANEVNEVEKPRDELLKNNFATRMRIGSDKLTKAFSQYPARGLKGSRNSNFYEFLTMGTVPYLIGSATLISVFNSYKKFSHNASYRAAKLGNKMALGVVFYGLFKNLSKSLISLPIKYKTGIDTELPYMKVNYLLPNTKDDKDLTSIEFHKVGESVDFPRWDLLYGEPKMGQKRNFRYDEIAKKCGLEDNLNDSDSEVKPIYKEVLVKSNFAKSISSYLWAATGVGLAVQDCWKEYFNAATYKVWNYKEFGHSMKLFGKNFIQSIGSLITGGKNAKTFMDKHAGKALLGISILSSVLGVKNALNITRMPSKVSAEDVMDNNKECVVG